MNVSTSGVDKGNAVELVQRSIDGEPSSPHDVDILATENSKEAHDNADMYRLGRKQQLKRTFHPLATIGLISMIMTTWSGVIASSQLSLVDGGRAGTLYLYLITWILYIPVVMSMAEMASMAPTCSGQYHWVAEFAPPSKQAFISYVSGWLSALGWQAMLAGYAFGAGQDILILANLNGNSFELKPWHGTLMTIAIVGFAASFNIAATKWLPMFEGLMIFFFCVGLFAVCIPLWVLAPKASSTEVWTHFNNGGGWSSTAGATIVGFIAASGALVGADAGAHMSEEVRNASLAVPRAMVASVLLNGAMGFIALVTYIYSIQDVQEQILESKYAFAFIGVFATATNSIAGAIGMTIPWAVVSIAGAMSAIAAGSRQAWAFARDGGLPFSPQLCKIYIVLGTPVPVNAVLCTMSITIILSLIQLGSSEAFNSILGLAGAAIQFSYAISIACVLWRRAFSAIPLPPARWSLGRWGVPINIAGCLFQLFCCIISFFPQYAKVTATNMNWASVVFSGVAIVSAIYYVVHGRKNYVSPVHHVRKE